MVHRKFEGQPCTAKYMKKKHKTATLEKQKPLPEPGFMCLTSPSLTHFKAKQNGDHHCLQKKLNQMNLPQFTSTPHLYGTVWLPGHRSLMTFREGTDSHPQRNTLTSHYA